MLLVVASCYSFLKKIKTKIQNDIPRFYDLIVLGKKTFSHNKNSFLIDLGYYKLILMLSHSFVTVLFYITGDIM